MVFQRINKNTAEKAYALYKNVQAVAADVGDAVVLDTATFDGVRITQPVTATLSLFIGIVARAIAVNAIGLVQLHGYASALVTNNTSVAIAAGEILVPVTAVDYLARSGASDGKSGFVIAGEAVATATTAVAALKKVFLRGL